MVPTVKSTKWKPQQHKNSNWVHLRETDAHQQNNLFHWPALRSWWILDLTPSHWWRSWNQKQQLSPHPGWAGSAPEGMGRAQACSCPRIGCAVLHGLLFSWGSWDMWTPVAVGSDLYGDNLCVIVGQQLNSRKKGVATHSWCMQKMGGNYDLTNKTTYGMGWFIPGVWSDKQDHLWYGVVYTRGMVWQDHLWYGRV